MSKSDLLCVALLATVVGCRDPRPGELGENRLFEAVSGRAGSSDDCGRPTRQGAITELVVVTADACLSCRDVGWLLRKRANALVDSSETVAVLTPASDAPAVCAYLASERTSAPVFASASTEGFRTQSPETVTLLRKSGQGISRFSGVNGMAVIRAMQIESAGKDSLR